MIHQSKSQKLYFIVLGLILGLIFSEILFRLLLPQSIEPDACRQPDPLLDHFLVPNTKCDFKTNEWNVTFNVNSLGLRDYDYKLQKPDNTFRILLLGDSFIEGYGINLQNTFGKILENYLNQNSSQKIQVLNAGVIGWGPLTEYLYLREYGILLKPNLVILTLNATDFFDEYDYYSRLTQVGKEIIGNNKLLESDTPLNPILNNSKKDQMFINKPMYQENVNDPKNIPFISDKIKFFLNQRFYVYKYLTREIKSLVGRAKVIEVSPIEDRGKIDKDLFAITRQDDISAYSQLLEKVEEDIFRMKKLALKNNADFTVVFIPHGHMVDGKQWAKGRTQWGFENSRIYSKSSFKEIAKWSKENQVEYFDLTPNLKAEGENQKIYFDYDGHLNTKGNEIAAHTLLAILSQKITKI